MDKKIKITYLLLGIGIGLICASTLYSFYPKIEYMDFSDDIIIEKARELGMVWLKESIDIGNRQEEIIKDEAIADEIIDEGSSETVEEILENKSEEPIEVNPEKEKTEEIEIVVESGSSLTRVARKLYDTNLIEDIDEFILFVKGKKLDKKIRTGRHIIESNSSYDEIIEVLTRRPN